jgi:hypothetical protein
MSRKRKRRSAVVEIGTGPAKVRIYTINRKDGHLRRIGSTQDPFGRVTPVLLFLPAGHLGNYNALFSSPDYDRVSTAFQRLQTLLRALVQMPGKPFQKSAGAFVPIFQIRIHQ